MFRLIIILFWLFIGFRLFLHYLVKFINYLHYHDKPNRPYNAQENAIQNLVRCEYCGVYIPVDEAVHLNAKIYCSKEHAKQC